MHTQSEFSFSFFLQNITFTSLLNSKEFSIFAKLKLNYYINTENKNLFTQ